MVNKKLNPIRFAGICALGFAALFFSSCIKTSPNYVSTTPVTAVSYIQALPDEPPVDIFIDNGKITLVPLNYGKNTDYLITSAGKTPVGYYTDVAMKKIVTDTINFIQNTTYSLFLVNTVSQPGLFLLTDTLAKPTAGNAAIRFINVSPDAPAVDLVMKGGAVLVPNKSFKGHSSFAPIPGEQSYTLEVHRAGTGTVLATLPSINLHTGSLYTIWFHGLAAGSAGTDALAVDIINNAYFQ